MSTDTPDYRLSAFADEQAEIARLAQQVDHAMQRELQTWEALGVIAEGQGLDVGCGPGFAAAAMMKRWPSLHIRGIDQDTQAVSTALQLIEAQVGSATDLPFEDRTFDLVTARLLLRHLTKPRETVDEMRRVLRDGGRVVLTDTDDATLLIEGAGPAVAELLAARRSLIIQDGADPLIGRKLRPLLIDAGLREVHGSVITFTSEEVGPATFRRVVMTPHETAAGFGAIDPALRERAGADLDRWANDERSFGMVSVMIFTGTR